MTSRSSRSTARAPTASPTRLTTSSPRPRSRIRRQQVGSRSRPRRSRIAVRPARSASAGIGSRSRFPPEAEGKSVFFSDDRRRLRRDLGRRQAAADAWQGGRGRRRRLQHAQSGRAQGPQAGQGLPDRRLRHQRTDLGRPVELDLSRRHVPRDRRQEMSGSSARTSAPTDERSDDLNRSLTRPAPHDRYVSAANLPRSRSDRLTMVLLETNLGGGKVPSGAARFATSTTWATGSCWSRPIASARSIGCCPTASPTRGAS